MSDEIRLGGLAEDVLKNEAFQAAVKKIESEVIEQWRNAKDAADREWHWMLTHAQKRLLDAIQEIADTGNLKASAIRRKQSLADRIGLRSPR